MVRLFEGFPVDQERAFQRDGHILEQHDIGNIEAALHEAQVGVMRTPFGGLTDRGPRERPLDVSVELGVRDGHALNTPRLFFELPRRAKRILVIPASLLVPAGARALVLVTSTFLKVGFHSPISPDRRFVPRQARFFTRRPPFFLTGQRRRLELGQ
jgi:hypothetical protein